MTAVVTDAMVSRAWAVVDGASGDHPAATPGGRYSRLDGPPYVQGLYGVASGYADRCRVVLARVQGADRASPEGRTNARSATPASGWSTSSVRTGCQPRIQGASRTFRWRRHNAWLLACTTREADRIRPSQPMGSHRPERRTTYAGSRGGFQRLASRPRASRARMGKPCSR